MLGAQLTPFDLCKILLAVTPAPASGEHDWGTGNLLDKVNNTLLVSWADECRALLTTIVPSGPTNAMVANDVIKIVRKAMSAQSIEDEVFKKMSELLKTFVGTFRTFVGDSSEVAQSVHKTPTRSSSQNQLSRRLSHQRPSFSSFDREVSSSTGMDASATLSNKLTIENLRLMSANAMLTNEVSMLTVQLRDCQMKLKAIEAVKSSTEQRDEITQHLVMVSNETATAVLSQQLERLANSNAALQSQLAAERTESDLKQHKMKADHDAFLLNVSDEFSKLQSSYQDAVERIQQLTQEQSAHQEEHMKALAQVQRNNWHMLERQYLGSSKIYVEADPDMVRNTLHDRLDGGDNKTCIGKLVRPPTAPTSSQSKGSSPRSHDQMTTVPPRRPFSRLNIHATSSSLKKDLSNIPPVFPRHTLAEILARYQQRVPSAK